MRHLQALHYLDVVAKAGSIRKAAETLSINSTALNRRILAFEEELGVQVFERLPRGVRLSSAGELVIHHVRSQIASFDRVKAQIADLSGVRRGHVAIAASQAVLPFFMPEQIAQYRTEHPAVTFSVFLRDRVRAEQALTDFTADLAVVFEPVRLAEFLTLITVRQPVHAVMAPGHPLAGDGGPVRLRDCLRFPVALPTSSYGVRHILEQAMRRSSLSLKPLIESDSFEFLRNHALFEPNLVSFQIPIGLSSVEITNAFGGASRPIDERDAAAGMLHMIQLRERVLPIAASRFADQLAAAFAARFECV